MAQKEFKKQCFEKLFNKKNVFFGYNPQNISWAVKKSKTVDTLLCMHQNSKQAGNLGIV